MLKDDPLLYAIKILGSRNTLIKLLGISAQRLNSWLNGNVAMGYEYALALEFLTFGQVKAQELSPQKTQIFKKLKIDLSNQINCLKLKNINITDIRFIQNKSCDSQHVQFLADSIQAIGLLRPVIVDENNYLIFGMHRLLAHQLLNKPTIFALVISLESVMNNALACYELKKLFNLSERVAIGIALEKWLIHKQKNDEQNNLTSRYPFNEQAIKNLVAHKVGLDSDIDFENTKKIILSGTRDLVVAIDDNKVSVELGARLAALPESEQREFLDLNTANYCNTAAKFKNKNKPSKNGSYFKLDARQELN